MATRRCRNGSDDLIHGGRWWWWWLKFFVYRIINTNTVFVHEIHVYAYYLLPYSMVQSPSWEANWFAASQEIPRISRNPKVHYRTHKSPPPVSILGQPNPVHIPTSHILEIHPNFHPSTPRSPQWSSSLRFPHQDPIHPLSSPIRATCPAHLILLDFINRTILGEQYRSFSSSLCNLLHSPVNSSLLGPNILLETMFSNTLSFLSSRSVNDQVSHPYKTTVKIIILYILIKAGGRTICLEIHKLITSIWKKKKLPEEWKESIIIPIHSTCNYRGISLLPTTYKILSNTMMSRLIPYAKEFIGIINVNFDATGRLLIIYSAFAKYLRKNENTMNKFFSSL